MSTDKTTNKQYTGRITLYLIITSLVAAMSLIIFGYEIGVSGGVTSHTSFLQQFFPAVYQKQSLDTSTNQYCKFDSEILILFTSSLYFAAFCSSFVASIITREFGRKWSIFIGGALVCAGALFNGLANSVWMLFAGRILLGFGIGIVNQSVPLYLSEAAPSKYRGLINIIFQLLITIGILMANVFNYYLKHINRGWTVLPGLIVAIGSIFMRDSPNSLIERGQFEEAKMELKRLRGVENVDDEFQDLVAAVEASKMVDNPWRNLLQRKYRPQLIMAILIPFFQQFTGINVIMFYAPVLYKTIGFGRSRALLSAVITGAVNVVATLVSMYGVDRWGRRALFLEGGVQMLVSMIAVTVVIGMELGTSGEPWELPEWCAILVVIFICIYVAGFAWSWGPLGWLVPSEIFPLEIRSAAQSITVSVNMFFTWLIAQVLLNMLCNLKFGLFFFFAFWVIVMTVFVEFFLPETKGIPIEEMTIIWEEHWYWSRFVPKTGDNGSVQMAIKGAEFGQV